MFLLKKAFQLRDKANPEHEKPFLEHLDDLRVMITKSLVVLMIAMTVCFAFQDKLMALLRAPVNKVQEIHMTKLLPADITPTNWEVAKQVERAATSLGGERGAGYLKEFDAPTLRRVEIVKLLRAIVPMPVEKREGFLKREAHDGLDEVVQTMLTNGASPEIDERGNLQMMSALSPTEAFMLSMKLAFFAGVVVSFPFLMLFILQFVLPGLHSHEQKILWPALAIGFGLFLFGVFFAYTYVLPRALTFFYEWGLSSGISNDWRIGNYITFATQFTLLFGLSFELPVVVMVFVKIGLLSYETMRKTRSYAILAIFVVAAIITPTPDAFTLLLMAGPMCVLYELCIWLAYFDDKKKAKAEAEEERVRAEEDRARFERLLMDKDKDHGSEVDPCQPAPGSEGKSEFKAETEGGEEEDRSEPWDPSSNEAGWKAGKETQAAEDDTPPQSIPDEEKRRMSDLSGDGEKPEK